MPGPRYSTRKTRNCNENNRINEMLFIDTNRYNWYAAQKNTRWVTRHRTGAIAGLGGAALRNTNLTGCRAMFRPFKIR